MNSDRESGPSGREPPKNIQEPKTEEEKDDTIKERLNDIALEVVNLAQRTNRSLSSITFDEIQKIVRMHPAKNSNSTRTEAVIASRSL